MKAHGRAWLGPDFVLAELHAGQSSTAPRGRGFMNPLFLDSATLVPLVGMDPDALPAGKPYVPMFVERVGFFRDPVDKAYVWCRRGAAADPDVQPDVLRFDCRIHDEAGGLAAASRVCRWRKPAP